MSSILIATGNLAGPGGSETYVLTIAEHLARLGHIVTLFVRCAGETADLAEAMGIPVIQQPSALPGTVDAVFSLDREFALMLSVRYPQAVRIFIMHNVEEAYLPPPVAGCTHATVALNDRHERRALAAEGAGRVVRLRQPIDTQRFSPRKPISAKPLRVALLGNYGGLPGQHQQRLREAWGADIDWVEIGGASSTTDVPNAIANVDVVVGYGRSIMEAMSCERAGYVFEHVGSSGWVTAATYDAMERDGFSGLGVRDPVDVSHLRKDLERYSTDLGWQGRELMRRHHDARGHADDLLGIVSAITPGPVLLRDPELQALLSLIRLNLLLSEVARGRVVEAQLLAKFNSEHIQTITAIYSSRRYRAGTLLASPLDWLRRTVRRD